MDVRVRVCPLDNKTCAADGSVVTREAVEEWLRSEDYKTLIDARLGLGGLTHRGRSIETLSEFAGNTAALKKTIGR